MQNENKLYDSFTEPHNKGLDSFRCSVSEDKQNNKNDRDFSSSGFDPVRAAIHQSDTETEQNQTPFSEDHNILTILNNLEYKNWPASDLIARIGDSETRLNNLSTYRQNKISYMQSECLKELETDQVPLKKKKKLFDFSKYETRDIALKVSYFGWNYDKVVLDMPNDAINAINANPLGLSANNSPSRYVEQELFDAMIKSKMIPWDASFDSINFKRVDVSEPKTVALCQIYTINSRSVFKHREDIENPHNDSKEMDYVGILNKILPNDIRVRAALLHLPQAFLLEKSIKYKCYQYFFKINNAKCDMKKKQIIETLKNIIRRYMGSHDFKNFCQLYDGKICKAHHSNILNVDVVNVNNDIFAIDFKGTNTTMAQIRSMGDIGLKIVFDLENYYIIDYLLGEDKLGNYLVDEDLTRASSRRSGSYGWIVLMDVVFNDKYEFKWRELADMDFRFNECYFDKSLKKQIQGMFAEITLGRSRNETKTYLLMEPIRNVNGFATDYFSNLQGQTICAASIESSRSEESLSHKELEKAPQNILQAADEINLLDDAVNIDELLDIKDRKDTSFSKITVRSKYHCCGSKHENNSTKGREYSIYQDLFNLGSKSLLNSKRTKVEN